MWVWMGGKAAGSVICGTITTLATRGVVLSVISAKAVRVRVGIALMSMITAAALMGAITALSALMGRTTITALVAGITVIVLMTRTTVTALVSGTTVAALVGGTRSFTACVGQNHRKNSYVGVLVRQGLELRASGVQTVRYGHDP